MDKQIEPCPVCKLGKPLLPKASDDEFWVCCKDPECWAQVEGSTPEHAVERWNTRTTPTPPAGQVEAVAESFEDTRNRQLATMQWQDVLAFAKVDVEGRALFKKFIAATPLENDIPVWMAEYAVKYQQASLKASGAEHIIRLGNRNAMLEHKNQSLRQQHRDMYDELMWYKQNSPPHLYPPLPPELRGK